MPKAEEIRDVLLLFAAAERQLDIKDTRTVMFFQLIHTVCRLLAPSIVHVVENGDVAEPLAKRRQKILRNLRRLAI